MDGITASDFEEMLMDNFSYHAYRLLPVLLDVIPVDSLDSDDRDYLGRLENWDYHNRADAVEPTIFYYWWQELNDAIWTDNYDTLYPMRRPRRDITVDLLVTNPESQWLDDIKTEEVETLDDLALDAFVEAIDYLENEHGRLTADWQWGTVRNTTLGHVAQIPGMESDDLFTGGGAESINAIRGSHGPSWRMVVELDPEGVRGYGVYPGGQSGNPGSKTYDEFVETWRTGELYELNFLREKPESSDDYSLKIRFE
jgi:penicillin amidase